MSRNQQRIVSHVIFVCLPENQDEKFSIVNTPTTGRKFTSTPTNNPIGIGWPLLFARTDFTSETLPLIFGELTPVDKIGHGGRSAFKINSFDKYKFMTVLFVFKKHTFRKLVVYTLRPEIILKLQIISCYRFFKPWKGLGHFDIFLRFGKSRDVKCGEYRG